jgi:hypothetical protein
VSSSVARDEPEFSQEFILRELAQGLWHEAQRPLADLPLEQFHEWVEEREREYRRRATPPFTSVEIPVDGEALDFDHLVEGSHWVAIGTKGKVTITLQGRHLQLNQVELVTVGDVDPYVEGSRRLYERRRNGPD